MGELVAFTQFLAREVRAGAHVVDFNPDQRWHRRLYRDGRVDVWLISWLPEQGTQLHDHGGSAGSFTVVEGRLSEAVLVRQRRRPRAPCANGVTAPVPPWGSTDGTCMMYVTSTSGRR